MTTKISRIYNAFTSGELSPRLDGRTDLDQYYKGVKTLENFFVHAHGGITKRPGTRFIAEAKDSTEPVILIPFEFSTTQAYILEFGHEYVRFYTQGGQLATSAGVPYEIVSPYSGEDLSGIKYAQSADVLYLTHPSYPIYKLSRFTNVLWILEKVVFYGGPFFDINSTDVAVIADSTTGGVNLSASDGIFDADHVGAFWKIQDSFTLESPAVSASDWSTEIYADVGEEVTIGVTGTWAGTITTQVSFDDGQTWIDIYTQTENLTQLYTSTQDNSLYRAGFSSTGYTSGTATISLVKLNYYGYMRIDTFTNSQEVSGAVIKELPHTNDTLNWAEGAWSDYRGYPTAISFYEQRLLFAGSPSRPQTIWGSQSDDFENFENVANNLDEAYIYTVASQSVNTIQWMLDHSRMLLFGTNNGEWKFGEPDTPTTPIFVNIKKQTPYGSANIQAYAIDRFAVYIQRGSQKIRSMGYDLRYDSFISPEVSLLAEHLMEDGIIDITYLSNPDPSVYMVDNGGDLIVLTLDPGAEVNAFSRWTTQGDFESIASIPASGGDDELWCVVKREIEGVDLRYIEYFKHNEIGDDGDYSRNYYVDSGIDGTFPQGTLTPSGAEHLNGETCKLLVDGATQADVVVSGGTFTMTTSGNFIITGLGYTAKVETMKLEIPTRTGSGQGKPMSTFRVIARLQDTVGLKAGDSESSTDIIPFRNSAMLMNNPVPIFSGDKEIFLDTGFKTAQQVWVLNDQPLPCTILALIIDIQVSEY